MPNQNFEWNANDCGKLRSNVLIKLSAHLTSHGSKTTVGKFTNRCGLSRYRIFYLSIFRDMLWESSYYCCGDCYKIN
jgi:hypothetical protein